jgi:hypothetical protein
MGLDFYKLTNSETLMCGSGYYGTSRSKNPDDNKKFTLQITSKVGQFIHI